MNIRPMDLQVLITRATEVSKAQEITDHQPTLQQQIFGQQWQQVMANRQHQVQGAAKNEGAKIQRGKEYKEKQDRGRNRKGQTDKEIPGKPVHSASAEDPIRGHNVDLKT
ncbi:hypothetical protein [Sporolituus thermophilus]|uniref:Uncharacterized protein n=1 Tax=Sporolituus thermophilus DSM 23256 TaxID=1123285 RepID=A0A1G7KQT0_9FIRM|nr:hypothetical protein [Sporolituus thermophilus]SDF39582.1 hypothetical protein SAMN05660235_01437 [Sporolituus thermophilus DSM 23256]